MLVRIAPDSYVKLSVLGVHSRFDVCSMWDARDANACIPGIYHASTPRGRVPILKVLFTNVCSRSCRYCVNRGGSDAVRRMSFEVGELVRVTMELYGKGLVRGIFLSSGVGEDPVETFMRMAEVARRLRKRGFSGYIHLKVLPGVPLDAVEQVAPLVNRLSYNLEAPTAEVLSLLSPEKSLSFGLEVLRRFGGSTQFVVDHGADGDAEYLAAVERLLALGVKRVYFKAFVPVRGTPMESLPPGRPLREARLYQAFFLIRDYGFRGGELLEGDGLPLGVDPKMGWAKRHPEFFPVEVTTADYGELLRVPGIGPRTARRIVALRASGGLSREGLKKLLPSFKKSAGFLTYKGRRLSSDGYTSGVLPLFSEAGAFGVRGAGGG